MVNSREKGKRGERAVVHVFRDAGCEAERRGHHQSRDGDEAADVFATLPNGIHLAVEAKNTPSLPGVRLLRAIGQAHAAAARQRETLPPTEQIVGCAAFHVAGTRRYVVAMDLSDFLEIVK